MKKFFFVIAILALGLTACNIDIEQPVETPVIEKGAAVYQVRIPASFGAETKAVDFSGTDPVTGKPTAVSSFKTTDNIYVYNQTKEAMLTGHLTPSADGKTCDLTGSLTGTIEANDQLVLLYNLSNYDSNDSSFDYDSQDGTQAGVIDGAMATVTASVDNDQLITATAHFQNVQSMFRFKFIDESSNAINVKHLVITSKNKAVASYYRPFLDDPYDNSSIPVTLTTPTTEYIYVALCIKESVAAGDELTFKAIDADDKVYTGTKAAPASGFVNGKYYYNASAITLTHDASKGRIRPTIVWTNPSTPVEPDYNGKYTIYSENIEITISGTSKGCAFIFDNYSSCTVTLGGLNADTEDSRFINSKDNNGLNIVVNGTNTITGTAIKTINCNKGSLKLSGNGTLTVTSLIPQYCGLVGNTNYSDYYNNNAWETTTLIDVSDKLAAPGYTVIRSARVNGPDEDGDTYPDYYTWTYTVSPGTKVVNLAEKTSDYTARNGDVLTGTLSGNYKISIADGATVTLAGITINGGNDSDNKNWAGITCEGAATLVLAEGTTNSVKPFSGGFAAISVPSGKTLIIQGSGSLTADARDSSGAGIGGNNESDYGNIVITGAANVTAYGGNGSAGIGSGPSSTKTSLTGGDITINTSGTVKAYGRGPAAGIGAGSPGREQGNRCGNILISKGTVEAAGGERGAGIGTGGAGLGTSVCGTITITDGVTSVTATKGEEAGMCIGVGYGGYCGMITIDGVENATTSSRFEHFNSTLSTTTNENDTWTLTHK